MIFSENRDPLFGIMLKTGGMMRTLCVRVGLAAIAAGLALGQVQAVAADAVRGKILFTQKYGCYECHGTEGQGSPVTGPRLAPDPKPFETIQAFVRSSNGPMPPFREAILPNDDLADIYAYLQSIKPAPDWKTIPLLNGK
jgi:mono/diheme cytochrome c family protein